MNKFKFPQTKDNKTNGSVEELEVGVMYIDLEGDICIRLHEDKAIRILTPSGVYDPFVFRLGNVSGSSKQIESIVCKSTSGTRFKIEEI